jgi:hypothetical protein
MRTYNITGPTRVIVEASLDAVLEGNLDTMEGEQYDTIENVISIEDDGRAHTFETCRSIEAYRRGEPNAGRFKLVIENKYLEKIHIPSNN